MKDNHRDIITLEKLLNEYRISSPAPPELKSYARLRKGLLFKKILKACGRYTLIYGIFSAIYFFLKKSGLWLSITKTVTVVALTASVTTGGYYAVKNITGEKPAPVEEKEPDKPDETVKDLNAVPPEKAVSQKSPPVKKRDSVSENFLLGIMPFHSGSVDGERVRGISKSLYGRLSAGRGSGFVKIIADRKMSGIKYTAFSSIEMFDRGYLVTVKVMDTKTTRIVYNTSRDINSLEEAEEEIFLIFKEAARLIEKR
jgi:hypothetical protein